MSLRSSRFTLLVLSIPIVVAALVGFWMCLRDTAPPQTADTESEPGALGEPAPEPQPAQAPLPTVPMPGPVATPGQFAGQLYADTGKPLAGAEVNILLLSPAAGAPPNTPAEPFRVDLDEGGRFSAALPFGAFRATVETGDRFAEHRFELSAARPSEYWTQIVGSAGWISGRVVGADGQGKADVPLAAMRDRTDYAYEKLRIPADGGAVSDETGAFQIRVPASAPHLWQIAALRHGAVAALSPSVTPGADGVVLRLPEDVTLRGRVLAAGTEDPVAGFTLLLESRPFFAGALEVTTGDDGGFTLEALPQGRYAIAPAEGSVLLTGDTDIDTWGMAEMDLALFTSLGSTVEGRVLSADGEAMPGIEVRVMRKRDTWRGESGDGGAYRVTGLPPGELDIRAWSESGLLTEPATIVFGEAPETIQKDLIVACNPVRGRVLLPDGAPVEGAVVQARSEGALVRATSGADGAFDLPCVPGHELYLIAKADGRESAEYGPIPPAEAAEGGVELVLDFAWDGFIAGRVVDGGGRPLPFAKVALNPVSGQRVQFSASTTTDRNGLFALVAGTPEEYEIKVSPQVSGFGELVVKGCALPVTLGPGERRTGLVVECSYPRGAIEGTVTDASGRPVGGATVNALGSGSNGVATSRGDGAFGIAGLEELPHIVVVQHPDFVLARQDDIIPDARGLQFRLQPRPLLRVIAADAKSNAPVERFSAALLSTAQRYPVFGPAAVSSPEGILEARVDTGALESSVTLQVVSEGYMTYEEPVRLDSSAPEHEFRVALAKAEFTLHGVVRDLGGAPLPGAAIHLDALPRNLAMTVVGGPPGSPVGGAVPGAMPGSEPDAVADAEGRFELSLADGEPRTVFAALDGYAPDSATGVPGESLVLELPEAGAVVVYVLKGGEPLMGARLSLAPDGLRGGTHHNGALQWTAVRPGPATLEVTESREPDAPVQTVEIDVQAGQVTEVTVTFP
ncbi:MAG: carboxypeptidase regulatory-like domain-containing protein [Candidatus Hydrogenedentes bacterium]|nr:carboxypeptidase regulatory-like domain-containing protein [Candidatus Hydrogenedentota bacterium]